MPPQTRMCIIVDKFKPWKTLCARNSSKTTFKPVVDKSGLNILPNLRGLHDSANYDDAVNSQTPCTATRAQPSQDLILFFATSIRPVLAQPGMSAGLRRQARDNNRRLGGWRERGNARAKGKRKTNVRGEVPRERQQEAARCELHGPDRGHAADQPQTEVSLFPFAT